MLQCPVYLIANFSDFSFEQFLANFSVVTELIQMPFGKFGQTVNVHPSIKAEPIRSTYTLGGKGVGG